MSRTVLPRTVISGIGIVSSVGIKKEEFWAALDTDKKGFGDITLFPTEDSQIKKGAEIKQFNPENLLFDKRYRFFSRSTKFALAAARIALEDSKIQTHGSAFSVYRDRDTGVVLGSTFGQLTLITHFDKNILQNGPRSSSPIGFAQVVYNSQSSVVSIWERCRALNITLSSGNISSLAAINLARKNIQRNRARLILTGGTEELSHEIMFKEGLGEGAVVIVLENYNDAKIRGEFKQPLYGEVIGFGSSFHKNIVESIRISLGRALIEARINIDDLDLVCIDDPDRVICNRIFRKNIQVFNVAEYVGDTLSASGAFQLAGGLYHFEKNDELKYALIISHDDANSAVLIVRRR
ncbi:beta-ketoacyl synthase N-terminal-like domain-containing protein [Chlamydiota bacterium]